MFFNLAWKNARQSRRENLIYFLTLITAAASFYIVTSLGRQDVIRFLGTIERDAVRRLLTLLMPTVYLCALLLLFFLVFFANKYQLECRSREIGLYLLLGMKRPRLFIQLLLENLFTALIALLGGLILGIFLSEAISLAVARLVGHGIIAHETCISFGSIAWTTLGFLAVQTIAQCILGVRLFSCELYQLLYGEMEKKQKSGTIPGSLSMFASGIAALAAAYILVIRCFTAVGGLVFYGAMILGILGTVLFIRGLSQFIRLIAERRGQPMPQGLSAFTLRQFQEYIVNKYISISAASILIMLAIMLIADGASNILINGSNISRGSAVYDFTITGNDSLAESFLSSETMEPYVSQLNPVKISNIKPDQTGAAILPDWTGLKEAAKNAMTSDEKTSVENAVGFSFGSDVSPALNVYGLLETSGSSIKLIPVSAYNRLLSADGKSPVTLAEHEAVLYLNPDFFNDGLEAVTDFIDQCILDNGTPLASLNNESLRLVPGVPMKGITADENARIFTGLIVPDSLFDTYADTEQMITYWNFCVPKAMVKQQGLLGAVIEISSILNTSGLTFESYLNNFGRQLFYIISGSYTTLYMGFMFLIIACALLALEFLTQLESSLERYRILAMLGARPGQIKQSLHRQVLLFFLLPSGLACISAAAGIYAMQLHLHTFSEHQAMLHPLMFVMAVAVLLILVIYGLAVARTGDSELLKLQQGGGWIAENRYYRR